MAKEKQPFLNKGIILFIILILMNVLAIWLLGIYKVEGSYKDFSWNIFTILMTLLATFLLIRLTVNRVAGMFKDESEIEQKIFFTKIYRWSIYTIGIAIILYKLGVSASSLAIFFGLAATGLGFAIRDVVLAFFAWLVLLTKKPFRIGDYIKVGDDEGKVMHIGTFYVALDKTPEFPSDFTKVPNKIFLEKSIYNFGSKEIMDTLTFSLKEYPMNLESRLEKIKESAKKITGAQIIAVNIDGSGDNFMIVLSYSLHYSKKMNFRTKLISQILKDNKDAIKFSS